ncbi:hypothetical protein F4803DRAFT_553466 [Xylaria telfairii]|nr:hypothetical protein F4803DRAFT_553466 [Xylaria telfairii]
MVHGIDHAADPALRAVWIFVGITFLFVPLRVYIRARILETFRADDWCYIISFACLLIYAILVTLSAENGLGKDVSAIHSPDKQTRAILDEMIGQTFLILGNVTSKLSIAFFLHTIAAQLVTRVYKIVLWTPVVLFGIFVIISLFLCWLPCQPVARLWDPRIDGHCRTDFLPIEYLAGALSVVVDVCYAIFPWWLLRRFHSHPKQKFTVLASLTLGLATNTGHGNSDTHVKRGENRVAIFSRHSMGFGIRANDDRNSTGAEDKQGKGKYKHGERPDSWISDNNVADGVILVREEVKVQKD